MKKSTSKEKHISKRKIVSKPSNNTKKKKSKKEKSEELDRWLDEESTQEKESEDGELEGLDGKEQKLFWFGPPPAIRMLYKQSSTEFDKDFHPADMLEHMRNGKTRSEIIAAWGITYTKFNDWLEAFPEMAEAYAVGKPAFDAYYKSTLRYVSFGQMPKAKEYSLHFMLKNFAGFDDTGGEHEYQDGESADLDFIDDEE